MGELRDRLEAEILERVPGSRVNGKDAERTPNTTSLRFEKVEGETLTIALDLRGYAVSTGAACSSGTVEPSHVLIAMGLSPQEVQGTIRVSLGKFTDEEEIEEFAKVLAETVDSVRSQAGDAIRA
jgi:cysteine desulfurase